MLNLVQRLILGCVLLATLILGLMAATHHALYAAGQLGLAWTFVAAAILVEIGTMYFVLRPIHKVASDAHKIAQGNLEHRTDWSSRDDFGIHCRGAEPPGRAPARPARLRGRPPADGVPALRRGAAIHLRAHHRDRRQGPHAQGEPGRRRAAGRSRHRPHGPHQHAGRRQDSERHPRRRLHAEGGGRRRRGLACCPCASASRSAATACAPRPCATPKAACWAP